MRAKSSDPSEQVRSNAVFPPVLCFWLSQSDWKWQKVIETEWRWLNMTEVIEINWKWVKSTDSENSRRLWLFLGSLWEFWRNVPGKFRETCGKFFPNRQMLQILGFGAPGKANLPGTLGPHCRDLVPTFRAGWFLKSTVPAFSSFSDWYRLKVHENMRESHWNCQQTSFWDFTSEGGAKQHLHEGPNSTKPSLVGSGQMGSYANGVGQI